MGARLVALAVADEPAAWQDAGFAVDDAGRCWLGDVSVALTPGTGKGVTAWAVDGIDGPVDGLPAIDLPPVEPVDDAVLHPNGTTAIDHVVVMTPDLDRTVAALEAAGLEARRVRDADSGGRAIRQVFFRLGDPVLEVVGPPEPSGDGPARFFGLALTVADLHATAAALEAAGLEARRVRDADSGGRSIRQVFFRLGDPVLEVVGPPEPSGDGPARFFGLALTVADLHATAAALGDDLGEVKDAVQRGRRIATLRRSAGCTTAIAFMSPPPPR